MARRFFSKKRRQRRLGEQFDRVSTQVEDRATRAGEAGLERSLAFDPTQAVSDFGSGFLDEAREGLGQDFESLTGQAVGRGRLRTGFFQQDAGRLFQGGAWFQLLAEGINGLAAGDLIFDQVELDYQIVRESLVAEAP